MSSLYDIQEPERTRERQDVAGRETRFGVETWHRSKDSPAYGFIGQFGMLRADHTLDQDHEQRMKFTSPIAMGIVNGNMPWFWTDRMKYALRVVAGYGTINDQFRLIFRNAAGDYIDKQGDIVPAPEIFTPDEASVRTLGGGGALSYRFGAPLTLAIGADQISDLIKGKNEAERHGSETREGRPFGIGQSSAVGKIGKNFEYAADGRIWRENAKATWVFSLSSGSGTPALGGRGNLYDRKEEGSTLRTRARWTKGGFEVGGGFSTSYRQIEIIAPPTTDSTSYNHFLSTVYYTAGSDTLVIPDSVLTNKTQDRSWEGGGGIAWTSKTRRLIAGAEFHRRHGVVDADLTGQGPKRIGWDARAGVEYGLSSEIRVRTGYIHGWYDRDDLLARNEFLSNGVSLGLGVQPRGASWSIETGYLAEWEGADYGDPGTPHVTRQQFSLRVYIPL